jgi:hypothetical protein
MMDANLAQPGKAFVPMGSRIVEPVKNAEDPEGDWITIGGTHVLVKDGESKSEAFKDTTGKSIKGGTSDKGSTKGAEKKAESKPTTPAKSPQKTESGDTAKSWESKTYENTLSKSEIAAIDEYRGPGEFTAINAYARTGELPKDSTLTKAKADKIIAGLDSAVSNSPPVPEGVSLYSGIGKTQGAEVLALGVGETFGDKDFQSFSTDIVRAKSASGAIAKNANTKDRVVLKFDGDNSTKGIVVLGSEGEVILGRDKQYVVTKKESVVETRKRLTGTEKITYHIVHVKMTDKRSE